MFFIVSGNCNRSFTVLLHTLQCLFVESRSNRSNLHISTSTNALLLYVLPDIFSAKYWNQKQHQRAYIETHGAVAMFSYGLFFFHAYLETYWQSWCRCSFYSPAQYQFLKLVAFKCYLVHLLLRDLILGASYSKNIISLTL